MIILLSQLFPPATLLASALLPSESEPPRGVRARPAGIGAQPAGNSLLETVFGLPRMPEERPYAL